MAVCSKEGLAYAVIVAAMIMLLSGSLSAQTLHSAQGLEAGVRFTVFENSDERKLSMGAGLYYGSSPRRTWHIKATQQLFWSKWSVIDVGVASRRFADNANVGYWLAGNLYGGYLPIETRFRYFGTGVIISGGVIGSVSAFPETVFFVGGLYGIGSTLNRIKSYYNMDVVDYRWDRISDSKAGLVGMEFNIGRLKMEAMVTISFNIKSVDYSSITAYDIRSVGYSIACYF